MIRPEKNANIVYNFLVQDARAHEVWPVFVVVSVIKTGFTTVTAANAELQKHRPVDILSDQIPIADSDDEVTQQTQGSPPSPAAVSPQKRKKRSQGLYTS